VRTCVIDVDAVDVLLDVVSKDDLLRYLLERLACDNVLDVLALDQLGSQQCFLVVWPFLGRRSVYLFKSLHIWGLSLI